MAEHLTPPTEYVEAIIDFLHGADPGIIEKWDATILQSVMDDDPADIWPDFHTPEGMEWWLISEVRENSGQLNGPPPDAAAKARAYTCEATLMVLRGFMREGNHE
ncbi:MAG: hypothetical protein H0U76_13940 [Ktedonobacteraceae bacterium]|nr:hypothetical protein [Ktedonobacteraceae bacterium]